MSARSRKRLCLQNGSPPGGRRWLWMVVGASGVLAAQAASADPQVVLPQGLPVQVKPTYTEPGLPAVYVSDFRRVAARRVGRRRQRQRRREHEYELGRGEHRRQRRRLQLDDVSELGFVCGQCGGRHGRERDGAGGDLCDGVELPERGFVRGEQCDRGVPDDQFDLQRGYQWRGGVRS